MRTSLFLLACCTAASGTAPSPSVAGIGSVLPSLQSRPHDDAATGTDTSSSSSSDDHPRRSLSGLDDAASDPPDPDLDAVRSRYRAPRGAAALSDHARFDPFSPASHNVARDLQAAGALNEFHGTTTVGFVFGDGADSKVLVAVDSRASMGSYVAEQNTRKVLPVAPHLLGTMAGGAADCAHWVRVLSCKARLFAASARNGDPRLPVEAAARALSDTLYAQSGEGLSVGTMIAGVDASGAGLHYVDDDGHRFKGDCFAVGSGCPFAYAVLDAAYGGRDAARSMGERDAVELGLKAIRHATYRDQFSGGWINVFVVADDGWRQVLRVDSGALAKPSGARERGAEVKGGAGAGAEAEAAGRRFSRKEHTVHRAEGSSGGP